MEKLATFIAARVNLNRRRRAGPSIDPGGGLFWLADAQPVLDIQIIPLALEGFKTGT